MRRIRPVAATTAVVLLTSGCAPSNVPASATRSPAGEPPSVFTSSEEALAAATDVFANYLTLINLIGADGGSSAERVDEYLGDDMSQESTEMFSAMVSAGTRYVGAGTFDSARFVQRWMERNGEHVQMTLCIDATDVRIVDASGADVTPADRQDRVSVLVELSARTKEDITIESSEKWGETPC